MKLIYGTTNRGKVESMTRMLRGTGIEVTGLDKNMTDLPMVEETGKTCLENAVIKATAYHDFFRRPVFSCDSGLYIGGLGNTEQPGLNIRRFSGKELSDSEMLDHYVEIIRKLGGRAIAMYRNAICLVWSENEVYSYDGEDLVESFVLVDRPHPKAVGGFPLDSISVDSVTGRYYLDFPEDKNRNALTCERGFRDFCKRSLGL